MSPLLGRPGLHGTHLLRRALLLVVAILIASTPLSILLAGPTWLMLTAVAVTCVIGSGVLLRLLLRTSVLVPLLQLVVAVGLVLIVERLHGLMRFSDGPRTLLAAQGDIIVDGFAELAGAWPPVVLQDSGTIVVLLLIILVVLGLDLMFLDLGWHTPTALALMGFMLVPALQQPTGGPWWTMLGPVIAGLLILATRTVHADPRYLEGDQRPQAGPVPAGGRTLAAVALCCLLVVGTTLPLSRMLPQTMPPRAPLSIDTVNQWQGRGPMPPGPVMIDDSVSVRQDLLRGQEREVLRYTSTAPVPPYLRLTALPRYEDGSFVAGDGMPTGEDSGAAPSFSDLDLEERPLDPASRELDEHRITLGDLGGERPPLPLNVRGLSGTVMDNGVVDTGDPGEVHFPAPSALPGSSYTVQTEQRTSTPEQLRHVPADQLREPLDLGVVTGEPPVAVAELAQQIADEKGATTAYDTAVAYQEHFRTSFAYSLTVRTPPGADPVQAFLNSRTGYCEQFAATFALMMNSQGYATRVSIGFTPGQRDGDEWVVTNHNAHAWPEVWFGPEHGWVPFEPTPRSAGNGVNAPPYTQPDDGAGVDEEPGAEPAPGDDAEQGDTDGSAAGDGADGGAAGGDGADAEQEGADGQGDAVGQGRAGEDASDGGGWGPGGVWGPGGGRQPWDVLLGLLALGAAAGGAAWVVRRRADAHDRRWQQAESSGTAVLVELAWAEAAAAQRRREWWIRLLGWTGWYGRPPVRLLLDPALPPNEALAGMLEQARDGGLPVGEREMAAAGRLGHALHLVRYAPPGVAGAAGAAGAAGDGVVSGSTSGGAAAGASRPGGQLRQDAEVLIELFGGVPQRGAHAPQMECSRAGD